MDPEVSDDLFLFLFTIQNKLLSKNYNMLTLKSLTSLVRDGCRPPSFQRELMLCYHSIMMLLGGGI